MNDDEKLILKCLSFFLPVFYIPLGIPLALKSVPPSGAYGFRTKRTLANTEVWYSVNFTGGLSLIFAGLFSLLFVYWLHRNSAGSIRKLILSYAISLLLLTVAVIIAFWLG